MLTRSNSRTLAKYTNINMPTVHAWMWMNENSQEKGKTYRKERPSERKDLQKGKTFRKERLTLTERKDPQT